MNYLGLYNVFIRLEERLQLVVAFLDVVRGVDPVQDSQPYIEVRLPNHH